MAKVYINKKYVLNAVTKSSSFKRQVRRNAENQFQTARATLVSDFENHPVTKEIDKGSSSNNSSGTLGGYGNLFSFIGFPAGSNPTSDVKTSITTLTTFAKRGVYKVHGNTIRASYGVTYPTISQLSAITPMPWEGGSWLINIEKGISNFSHYMSKQWGGGRSRGGLQVPHTLRMANYSPTPYYTPIIQKFILSLK